MKERVDSIDATPSKRLYLSIIADYDINKAICELVDNALDIWSKNGRTKKLNINIQLDSHQQTIQVSDNAGGVDRSELSFLVGPGHSGNVETDESIGIFGVGTKRAVVALAQDVSIRTRRKNETYAIEFDDLWIGKDESWQLDIYRVDDIPVGNTEIELVKLRKQITDETEAKLRQHLSATYAKFLSNKQLVISLNANPVSPIKFDNWAYPPGFEPREYRGEVVTTDGKKVRVCAVAGLTMESSPAGGEYGVYFYCNDRLTARASKTLDVGFASGLAGKPHADISLARVLVSLEGEARLMPWNSSKSDIDPSHEVFIILRGWLIQVVKDYTSLARRLSKFDGGWQENVFKYPKGQMETIEIADFPSASTSYLPPLPAVQPRFSTVVKKENESVAKRKPWTRGLYESVIAVDWVLKQGFDQKNRIALMLLDSTLEIAFKEYLVRESGQQYSNNRLQGMFSNRHQVHNEVKNLTNISARDWGKIEHYYDIRCNLTHQKASVTVSDTDIDDFRSVVQRVLTKLFKLKFKPN